MADTACPPASDSDVVVQANASAGDVQKKISLLSNPSAIIGELFPHTTTAPDPLEGCLGAVLNGAATYGGEGGAFQKRGRSQSKLVLVASLVSKMPNLGGMYCGLQLFRLPLGPGKVY